MFRLVALFPLCQRYSFESNSQHKMTKISIGNFGVYFIVLVSVRTDYKSSYSRLLDCKSSRTGAIKNCYFFPLIKTNTYLCHATKKRNGYLFPERESSLFSWCCGFFMIGYVVFAVPFLFVL